MSNDSYLLDADQEVIEATVDRVADVKAWFEEAKTHRQIRDDRWRKNEKLYYGDHWHDSGTSQTKMVFNYALSGVETALPNIADYLPTIDIMPREKDDIYFADMMQKRFNQIAELSKLFDKILDAIKDSLIYSNGFIQILPVVKDSGNLEITVEVIDPFTVFPDKWATGVGPDQCKRLIFATPMYVDDIEAEYGVEVVAEGAMDEYRAFQITTPDESTHNKDMALVIECFTYDEDGEYPNGRFTAICGEKLLIDEDIELPSSPNFMIGNYKSPHAFYGIGEPELNRTQIKSINEVMSAIADNIRLTGNPLRKMSTRAKAKNPKRLTGKPGETVTVDDINEYSYENPPSIPAYVQHFVEQIQRMQDSITGYHDVTQGRRPVGVTSAKGIMALQESAQTRIRYKITKEITQFVKDIGNYIVDLIKIYDEEMVTIRERDTAGQYQFVQYNPMARYDADGNEDKDGKLLEESQFDISVATGFRIPTGRMAKEEQALERFQMGVYGIEQVVEALNEPNKQELIESYYQRQGMQMQEEGGVDPEILEKFKELVGRAFPGTPEEDELNAMLTQHPELLNYVTDVSGIEGEG